MQNGGSNPKPPANHTLGDTISSSFCCLKIAYVYFVGAVTLKSEAGRIEVCGIYVSDITKYSILSGILN